MLKCGEVSDIVLWTFDFVKVLLKLLQEFKSGASPLQEKLNTSMK